MRKAALISYVGAIIIANLFVGQFGPVVTPITAFVLIGFVLVLRDWLHYNIKPYQMFALLVFTGGVTYAIDQSTASIAVASSVAFTVASIADWATFALARGSWERRSHLSNIAGSLVDSLLFPTLAFWAIMPGIVAGQFAAKMIGATVWVFVVKKVLPEWVESINKKEGIYENARG